jgi:hypothetical protein
MFVSPYHEPCKLARSQAFVHACFLAKGIAQFVEGTILIRRPSCFLQQNSQGAREVAEQRKFQAHLANADSCPQKFPTWLKRPFIITCPALRTEATEAIEEAASTKIAADRAQPGEKAAAEAAARTAAHKAEELQDAVPEELRAYGITVCGAALGDDAYIKDFLLSKQTEICGDIGKASPGTIATVTAALAEASAHAASTAIHYSLQCRIDYLLETHLPVHTRQLAQAVDQALRKAYKIAFGIDLLDPEGPIPGQDDPSFLCDLAGLKTSAGGCGYRRTERRTVFLNVLNTALPQLMCNEVEPGLWPSLASVLGAESFSKQNEDRRWEAFFNSGSAWAEALHSEITRVKDLRSKALEAANKSTSPPESKIFDVRNEAFGKGI